MDDHKLLELATDLYPAEQVAALQAENERLNEGWHLAKLVNLDYVRKLDELEGMNGRLRKDYDELLEEREYWEQVKKHTAEREEYLLALKRISHAIECGDVDFDTYGTAKEALAKHELKK